MIGNNLKAYLLFQCVYITYVVDEHKMEICLRGKRLITRNNYLTVCWFECVTRGQSSLSCNRSFKIQTYQKCNSKEFISIKERKKKLIFYFRSLCSICINWSLCNWTQHTDPCGPQATSAEHWSAQF